MHSKANLLTLGCGEIRCSVNCCKECQARSPGQLVLKRPELLKGFQGQVYKDRVREGMGGVCDQLLDILLIPWQLGKQESTLSTFWFQLIWAAYCSLLPHGGGFSICKITQRSWLRILSTDLEEELNVLSSVQLLSCVRLFVTPWIPACKASLFITNSQSLLKLMPIKSVMPSGHLILCRPLLLMPPIPPSIRVFSSESSLCMRWPKYWNFSFKISPSIEHPGPISFRMYWLDLLVIQGTLKSLLQHHSSKASIFWHSAFFTVQLSHPYLSLEKP